MSDDKNFDKIFSEITSPENIGSMPSAVGPLSLNNARDYSLFLSELITAIQEINLIISQERFETYITPLIKNKSNIKLSTRPKEDDLIYFPLAINL